MAAGDIIPCLIGLTMKEMLFTTTARINNQCIKFTEIIKQVPIEICSGHLLQDSYIKTT